VALAEVTSTIETFLDGQRATVMPDGADPNTLAFSVAIARTSTSSSLFLLSMVVSGNSLVASTAAFAQALVQRLSDAVNAKYSRPSAFNAIKLEQGIGAKGVSSGSGGAVSNPLAGFLRPSNSIVQGTNGMPMWLVVVVVLFGAGMGAGCGFFMTVTLKLFLPLEPVAIRDRLGPARSPPQHHAWRDHHQYA
jgi:hypothetical protein